MIPVISNWQDLKQASEQKRARIHLKFDTGFSRLGLHPEKDIQELKQFLDQRPHIQCEGLASQLVSGENLQDKASTSSQQARDFSAFVKKYFPNLPGHMLNTPGFFSQNEKESWFLDLGFRPGIGLYGFRPCKNFHSKTWQDASLQPASCLKSYVAGVRCVEPGDVASYGGKWRASKPSIIATVSMGYGQGLMRSFNKGQVLFSGKLAPVVGDICMDFFMIDVSKQVQDISKVKLGAEVVIFGKQQAQTLTLEDQADVMGTIPYEVLVRLSSSVTRKYLR